MTEDIWSTVARANVYTDFRCCADYEVPSTLYDLCLGPCKKYSCGEWADGCTSLEISEVAALTTVCARAQINADKPYV